MFILKFDRALARSVLNTSACFPTIRLAIRCYAATNNFAQAKIGHVSASLPELMRYLNLKEATAGLYHETNEEREAYLKYFRELQGIINQASDFQKTGSGDVLGLWLLTVVVGHQRPLPGKISLKSDSLGMLRISGEVLKSVGLAFDLDEAAPDYALPPPVAWAYVVPSLYSYEALQTADPADVLRLPRKVCKYIAGKPVSLDLAHENPVNEAGVSLYYLPVVVKHPQGLNCEKIPQASNRLAQFVHALVSRRLKLGEGEFIAPSLHPYPYSIALEAAQEMIDDSAEYGVADEYPQPEA